MLLRNCLLLLLVLIAGSHSFSQSTREIDSLNNLSWNTIYSDKLRSVSYQERAYNQSINLNYKKGEAEALLNKGVLLFSNGDYPNALNALHQSLQISNEYPETDSKKAVTLNQIARIYIELEDYAKAQDYLDQSIIISRQSADSSQLAGNFINYGIIMANQFLYDSTFAYYQEALTIYQNLHDTVGMITAYNNLGNYMAMNFRFKEERDYYQQAFNLSGSNDGLRGEVLYNISESYYAEGDLKNALESAKQAFELSKNVNSVNGLKITSGLMSRIYEETGQHDLALKYYKKYKDYSDNLFNELTLKKITETEMRSFFKDQMRTDSLEKAKVDFEKKVAYESEIGKQKTWALAGSFGFVLMLALAVVLFRSNRAKQSTNLVITQQKQEVVRQMELVEEKNREIVDSITYARRLQEAILPSSKVIKEMLPDSFVLYKPKDIVAGDFYFLETVQEKAEGKVKDIIYYAAVDCTGHGVPGAMVSVVGANGLKRCIKEFGLRKPGEILDKLSELVSEAFEQSEEKIRDGMDVALCRIDVEDMKLSFAGANNPLWVINQNRTETPEGAIPFNEEIGFEFKATKQAIGYSENRSPFKTVEMELKKGDALYVFSDGFADQFGGEKSKKFKSANFKKLLVAHHQNPMEDQKELIDNIFETWKGDLEQVDDVCVIGVKI